MCLGGSEKGARITWCELGWIMRWATHNAILGFMFLQEGDGIRDKTLRVTDPNNEILLTVMSLTFVLWAQVIGGGHFAR